MNIVFFSPFRQRHCNLFIGYHKICSFVNVLLGKKYPFTVLGFVTPIVINSFNAVLCGWLFPHVFKEIFKFEPFSRYPYSSATIVFVCLIFFIGASLNYTIPNLICWGSFAAVSVCRMKLLSLFCFITTTGYNNVFSNSIASCLTSISTRTLTEPSR